MQEIPSKGFVRVRQIVGDKNNPGPIPVSRAAWYAGVKAGRFPQPIRLTERCVAWRTEDIHALIEELSAQEGDKISQIDKPEGLRKVGELMERDKSVIAPSGKFTAGQGDSTS